MEWVSKRIAEARRRAAESSGAVPEAVVDVLEKAVRDELHTSLKPEQLRDVVRRLAGANRGDA
jgi:hypothetical protein